ncbi:tryptophan 7-halogenase [Ectothiorhodospiraceae bacterium WFHF3C12]|nr:tryptophan 7-halogenase [Ectothiorhodospiraceae bacterium WFHF3C12]
MGGDSTVTETGCDYDVLVIGGGPAGATMSTFLADRGRGVAVIEKDVHPRFHIGESLLPLSMPVFERLGVVDKVADIGMIKYGAEFVSPWHRKTQTYYFGGALDKAYPYAYQVKREDLDRILIDNAADKGVAVSQGSRVVDAHRHGGRWDVAVEDRDGGRRSLTARYLVDASGRDTFMGKKLGIKQRNPNHNSAAIFSHFENAERLGGIDEGNISVFWFDHGWFWFIPFRDGSVSVGAVCWPDYLKTRNTDVDSFLLETIQKCPPLAERLRDARMTMPARATGNFSYQADRIFGDGYMLLGDAYAFVDPVFSSGVHIALNSATHATEVVEAALREDPELADIQARYEERIHQALEDFSWFIYRITQPAMRRMFLKPRNVLRVKEAILSLLAGDLFRDTPVRWRLQLFKAFYAWTYLIHLPSNIAAKRRRQRAVALAAEAG